MEKPAPGTLLARFYDVHPGDAPQAVMFAAEEKEKEKS
jgi:hypothetical protein